MSDIRARSYSQRAQYATSRRLLACLINENRVIASIYDVDNNTISITSKHDIEPNQQIIIVGIKPDFMTLCRASCNLNESMRILELLDSDDFVYPFYIGNSSDDNNCKNEIQMENDPVALLTLLCPNIVTPLKDELMSSVANQIRAYQMSESEQHIHRNTGDMNQSALVWEQSIVEGHPTHPMHRTRGGWSFEESGKYVAECYGEPKIYFVEIARSLMLVRSNFERLLAQNDWCPAACDPINNMVMPVHEGQHATIQRLFIEPGIAKWVVNPITGQLVSRDSSAQVAIRTVSPVGLDYHLKMSVNFQTTSNKRTISQHSIYQGPALGHLLSKTVPSQLHIVDELAAARYIGGDNHAGFPQDDIARQLGVIIRADPEKSLPTESIILAAALSERVPGTNIPWLIQLNVGRGLETEAKRIEFFTDYANQFLNAFVPPVRDYGIAIECHSQNTLVRFDRNTKQLLGFGFRDFGGISFHRPTMKLAGIDSDAYFTHNSTSVTDHTEELYDKIFHCGIHSNLFQIMKSLNLHYSGIGCRIIYDILHTLLPATHPALTLWLQPRVYYKGFITMRLANSPFDHGNVGNIPRVNNFLKRYTLVSTPIIQHNNQQVIRERQSSKHVHEDNNNIIHGEIKHTFIGPDGQTL